jgi:hypothetical protein
VKEGLFWLLYFWQHYKKVWDALIEETGFPLFTLLN